MQYIRFKIPLEEASFFKNLDLLVTALIISLRGGSVGAGSTITPQAYKADNVSVASGQHGKTYYKSNDIEDRRVQGPSLYSDLEWKHLGYNGLDGPSQNDANLIWLYNKIIETVKDTSSSAIDTNFLFALRNAAKLRDYDGFYQLVYDQLNVRAEDLLNNDE